MDVFTDEDAIKKGLLPIAGIYLPIHEILIIKRQQFLTKTFIYVKTIRTNFVIDFGVSDKDNNRIVDSIVNELNTVINKYKEGEIWIPFA